MTRQEYRQLSPEEQKEARKDLIIAICCTVPTVVAMLIVTL